MAASGFVANQLHADGGMQKMIESMKEEIDRTHKTNDRGDVKWHLKKETG